MTLTPNLALPYPELADTADVPRDIKALAVKLDALLGGGGSGGGGGGAAVGANLPVLDVGVPGQIRAGRQLTVADFTSLGLGVPVGLFNLSGLTNLGSGGALTNLGAVPFAPGINGVAGTAAAFAGSTGQALYISDTGAADPYRIRTGSWGCWFRTAKRGAYQNLITKFGNAAGANAFMLQIGTAAPYPAVGLVSLDGTNMISLTGVTDVCDDRWHFAALTHDATTLALFVDGALEATAAASGPMFGGAGPVNIGAWGANGSTAATQPHYGRVDEAFITADVLTDDQVRLLYCSSLTHTLGALPSGVRLAVHRRRKGGATVPADYPAQPVRLHNFTAGALTDQGAGGVTLTNNGGAVSVAGADGSPGGAYSFAGAQSLSSTDAGLPGGLTARSYGAWFKTGATGTIRAVIAWGLAAGSGATIYVHSASTIVYGNGADEFTGPFVGDGQWHHAVSVEDNTAGDGVRRKFYLDGRLVGGSTVMNAITLGGATQPRFRVGSGQDGAALPFTGQIDGAFVSAQALTGIDVSALYAKGVQDPGASPKNAGDHVERADAAAVLAAFDTLGSQMSVDIGVVA